MKNVLIENVVAGGGFRLLPLRLYDSKGRLLSRSPENDANIVSVILKETFLNSKITTGNNKQVGRS